MRSQPLLLFALFVVAASLSAEAAETTAGAPTFEKDVLPVFQRRCAKCHSERTRKAELNVLNLASLLKGGESGPSLAADPENGLLYEYLHEGAMPPEGETPLTDAERARVLEWLREGAPRPPTAQNQAIPTAQDVLPILLRRCSTCHGAQFQEAGLDLRRRETMLKGGQSGAAIVPNQPEESLLIQKIAAGEMPPPDFRGTAGIEAVTPDELSVLRRWIAGGAPAQRDSEPRQDAASASSVSNQDREFWSLQPPVRAALPQPPIPQSLTDSAIDAFLEQPILARQLDFAPAADRESLIRRATLDLHGLPPSPEEVIDFVSQQRPDAYERLLDRLLGSPSYGERWGRYWLDLAGYADSEGKRSADMIRPFAWRYRDYVIRAFNRDLSYDAFLTQQIAGDELADYEDPEQRTEQTFENLVATGFLRMAPDGTTANPVNRVEDRLEVIADEIDILSRGLLGLTMKCAQCHSHKYDPIPQRDYYRLVAIFKGAYDEYDWMTPQKFTNQWAKSEQRYLPYAPDEETQAWRAEVKQHAAQLAALQAKQKAATDKSQQKNITRQINNLKKAAPIQPMIRALWDRGRPSNTFVYRRGDHLNPGPLVQPGVPAAIATTRPFALKPPWPGAKQTGRRLAFARWLTQPDHPLTSRVLVNRVWHHHFGAGLVRSLDNFGKIGQRPTHPKLLDWLAVEFVDSGWSMKHLHRRMMSTRAYRQASSISPAAAQRDPDNKFLSRMPLVRLDAESLRDSVLAVSGRLSSSRFGPPDVVDARVDGLVTVQPSGGMWRRSIYARQRRREMPTMLETFDLPQMSPNCSSRFASTVVTQPLHLWNNKLIHDLAISFAERVQKEAGSDRDAQVRRAILIAHGTIISDADAFESVVALERLKNQWQSGQGVGETQAQLNALADFCHVLLNSARFLYVD